MKKTIIASLMVLVVAFSSPASTSLSWGTDGALGSGSGPDLFGTDLSPLNATSGAGYVVKLYVYTGVMNPVLDTFITSVNYVAQDGAADGILLTSIADIGPAGFNLGGKTIYTAIWNPSATMYHVLPATKTIQTFAGDFTDPISLDYNAGIQAATAYTVAVPEPSTLGLLLVGAGLVAFRRMRRS